MKWMDVYEVHLLYGPLTSLPLNTTLFYWNQCGVCLKLPFNKFGFTLDQIRILWNPTQSASFSPKFFSKTWPPAAPDYSVGVCMKYQNWQVNWNKIWTFFASCYISHLFDISFVRLYPIVNGTRLNWVEIIHNCCMHHLSFYLENWSTSSFMCDIENDYRNRHAS